MSRESKEEWLREIHPPGYDRVDSEEINITEVLIGIQGSGKSWYAMERAAQIATEYDCPLVIHHCGSAAIMKRHNPYHEADWKLCTQSCFDSDGKQPVRAPKISFFPPPILVVNTAYAEDALQYADAIRKKKECVVLIDEVTAAKSIVPQNIGEPWRTRIAQRRAMKTALILCMQSPTMASRFLIDTATSVKCFRLGGHKKTLKAAGDVGYSDEQIEQITKLPRGEYIELKQGFGTK